MGRFRRPRQVVLENLIAGDTLNLVPADADIPELVVVERRQVTDGTTIFTVFGYLLEDGHFWLPLVSQAGM
jgi:hypothetical protein